jgi:hypothetical protein
MREGRVTDEVKVMGICEWVDNALGKTGKRKEA